MWMCLRRASSHYWKQTFVTSITKTYCTQIRPINMAFEEFGSDKNHPPLIIMHGLFGSKQNFRSIARALERRLNRRIFTVDARNHGDSPHTAEHTVELMAADVVEFMRQQKVNKACVIGHSMGGRAMMYLALKYPEYVERGVIVDVSPISVPRDFSHMLSIMQAMKEISIPTNLSLAQGRSMAVQQIKDVVGDLGTVNFIIMNLKKSTNGEFVWKLNLDALQDGLHAFGNFKDAISGLFPFAGPIIFICGTYSNFVDPAHWPQIREIFLNADQHWLETGHLVHFEQPTKFIDLVTNFVNV